jgi:hypothetical protein
MEKTTDIAVTRPKLRLLNLNREWMPKGRSGWINWHDILLGMYHGKNDAYPVRIYLDLLEAV